MIDLPDTPKSIHRSRQILTGIFVILAMLYLLATPIWEASDELSHYPVVDYIARTGELPYQDPDVETRWHQEGSQPPLYYMLTALLIAPLNRGDLEEDQFYNPYAKIGIGLASDNQNMIVHDAEAEAFPWHGSTLAVMLIRLFSILLGTGTVWLIFAAARLAIPNHPQLALLAMALTVFNPMLLFITASVNNDNLVIFLGTLSLVLMLSLWRNGWDWRRITMLAIILGFASLTKLSGLTFAPVAGLVILWVHQREKRPILDLLIAASICAFAMIIIAGWWYVRNIDLYGDPTGLNVMVDIAGHRPDDFVLSDLWAEREGFFYSFWGWFGALNVLSPRLFFNIVFALCLFAAIGLLVFICRDFLSKITSLEILQIDWQPLAILALQILIIFIGVIRWTLQTPASQGRLLFPGIAAINILLAVGIFHLLKIFPPSSRLSSLWGAFIVLPLALYALALPYITIRPAYDPPETIETLPSDVNLVDVHYGSIQLLGYQIDNTPVESFPNQDDEVTITLYWLPHAQTESPFSFSVEVFAPPPEGQDDLTLIGVLNTYPGRGLRRTDQWEADQIYQETYHIVVEDDFELAPFEPRFKISWRDNETNEIVHPTTSEGSPIEAVVLRGGSIYDNSTCEPLENTRSVKWGELARLVGVNHSAEISVEAGSTFDVLLQWETLDKASENLTIFMQLIDPETPADLRGSGDNIPREEWYPTSAWVGGNCFNDHHTVTVFPDTPSGTYQLLIGLYNPENGQRLFVSIEQGERSPFSDAYLLDFEVVVTNSSSTETSE